MGAWAGSCDGLLLRGFQMADDVPSTFVVPDPASASSSDAEAPQSAQKQKPDSESEESMSESQMWSEKRFKDSTELPDLVGSEDELDDEPSERMAKDLADELVRTDSDNDVASDEESGAGASKHCGKGKHSRPDRGWMQVRRYNTAELTTSDILNDLKELAQELHDLSGTDVPKCKFIFVYFGFQPCIDDLFLTAIYSRKSLVPQPILQSDWRAAMLPWKHARSYESSGSAFRTSVFYCPMRSRATCKSELRLIFSSNYVALEQSCPHEADSHSVETPHRLSVGCEGRIHSIVGADMKMSVTEVRRSAARSGEDVTLAHHRKVKRAVKRAREHVMHSSSPIGTGFPNTDNIGDVRRYAEAHDMKQLLELHNAEDEEFHLKMHDMMVIGKEFSAVNVEFSIFFSNVWFLLTAFRIMIAGWPLQIFTDIS